MMPQPLAVVGAGGFGREVLDVIEAINAASAAPVWDVLGVIDDEPSVKNLERLAARGVSHLGPLRDFFDGMRDNLNVAVGVGSPSLRQTIVNLIDGRANVSYPVLLHPGAHVGSEVSFGAGTITCGGAQVSTNVQTGAHVHLNPSATVGHDTVLADFVSVNPNATVSGECWVEDQSTIGAGSVLLQGVRVGRGAMVGASACVVRDVPRMSTVKGVPAR